MTFRNHETLAGHDAEISLDPASRRYVALVLGYEDHGISSVSEDGFPSERQALAWTERTASEMNGRIQDDLSSHADVLRRLTRARTDVALTGDDRIRGSILAEAIALDPVPVTREQALSSIAVAMDEVSSDILDLEILQSAVTFASTRRKASCECEVLIYGEDGRTFRGVSRSWELAANIAAGSYEIETGQPAAGIQMENVVMMTLDEGYVDDVPDMDEAVGLDVKSQYPDVLGSMFDPVPAPRP
jgi:hypothetical protein